MEPPSRRLSATVVKESEKESQIFRDWPDAQPRGNLAKQLLEASSYREKRYGVVGDGGCGGGRGKKEEGKRFRRW